MIAKSGSQSVLCSMPFRYDTYRGCTHGCLYCFATKANKKFKTKEEYFTNIEDGDIKGLENFLKSPKLEPYMDKTPIHWGGMSDGFQPIEEQRQLSYQSLLLFAKYKYPVVISTKGIPIISSDKYIDILKQCKVVVQISILSKETETWDKGTVGYEDRLKGIKKLMNNGIKVVIRNQPYMVHYQKQVLEMIRDLKGVDGFIVEGFKDTTKFAEGLTRIGREFMYPIEVLFKNIKEIRNECKKQGIRFFCGENRLRWLGEDVNCCGVAHIDGFENSNNLNVTQLFYHKYITFSNMGVQQGSDLDPGAYGRQDTIGRKVQKKLKNMDGKLATGGGTLVQDTINNKALVKLNEMGGNTPTNGLVQDTIGSKSLKATNESTNNGFYLYLKHYVNNGGFAKDYELEAVGKDKNGNYVFEYKNKEIEAYRKKMFKNNV